MLSYEWRELETLCERIGELRERYGSARKSQNTGLTTSLKNEIDQAQRQRELLVQHISARLGSVAAGHPEDPDSPVNRARRQRVAAREASHKPSPPVEAPEKSDTIFGFEER